MRYTGIVYLIGAGPGDPKLITMRGVECLSRAEVVIYDRLVNPRLLAFARPQAEKIFVGKGPGVHQLKQEEINQLLIDKAREGMIVARLKGGDPFVFGRGGEEAEALAEAGIPFEVVPGVTSAVAVPAYAGIPVTHRAFNSVLTIVTGHEDPEKEESSIAWGELSRLGGTLVFLMGLDRLASISERLIKEGKSPQTPVALVQWGTLPEQRVVIGQLSNIAEESRRAGLTSPVVIVVGEVVNLREKLKWVENRPLFGKRIAVTRSRKQASVLSRRLESLGAEVWEFPTIEIAPAADFAPLDWAIDRLSEYQWIIFTSANGVEAFLDRLWHRGGDVRRLKDIQLVAIGPGTARALEARGLRAVYVPEEYRAEGIVEGVRHLVKPGDRVLLPRARGARPLLPERLSELGVQVDEVVAYETVTGQADATLLQQLLRQKMLHAVTFTSSSTVRNFVSLLDGNLSSLEGVVVACIGPITADTAVNLGLKVDVVATEFTIEGLVRALTQYFLQRASEGEEDDRE